MDKQLTPLPHLVLHRLASAECGLGLGARWGGQFCAANHDQRPIHANKLQQDENSPPKFGSCYLARCTLTASI
jgi:hypothetical protein